VGRIERGNTGGGNNKGGSTRKEKRPNKGTEESGRRNRGEFPERPGVIESKCGADFIA